MKRLGLIVGAVLFSVVVHADLSDGLYADFDTSMGSFTCRLDYVEAPLTCANFVGLIEGSQSWIAPVSGAVRNNPFYDGLIFHRVIDGFMIQGGCPLGTGTSGPGYTFPDEISTNLIHDVIGTLSMANSGLDSNGSQFFITLAPTPWLDGKHSVFGEVIGGLGVVTNIGSVATTNYRPLIDVVINQIRIRRVGTEAEDFNVSAQPLPEVSGLTLSIKNTQSGWYIDAGISNHTDISIYSSQDLSEWTSLSGQYFPEEPLEWSQLITTSSQQQFYRGSKVYYPQANTIQPLSVEGHVIDLDLPETIGNMELTLLAGGSGFYRTDTATNAITYWELIPQPYQNNLYMESVGFVPFLFSFSYDSSTNGPCSGLYYNSVWNSLGTGVFTDTPAP